MTSGDPAILDVAMSPIQALLRETALTGEQPQPVNPLGT
jgi:hypothetical protein